LIYNVSTSSFSTTSKEDKILLALQAINQNQIQSVRCAVKSYRRAGIPSRRDCEPNSKRLSKLEEQVIIDHILDLDPRGFPPNLEEVRDMASKLLANRQQRPVGINWPSNKTRFNRKYDYQSAKCEDPEVTQGWFDVIRNTEAKYGIADEDTYNFDETGFQMGIIAIAVVVRL